MIQADLDRLIHLHHQVVDYAATGQLAPVLIGELQACDVRLPPQRREVLLGLINAHRVAMRTAKDLGGQGLPGLAARAMHQCAEALEDPVWLGRAAFVRGAATGELDPAGQYHRSAAAAESLTGRLDSTDGLQTCGMLHLMAATAAGARGDHDMSVTHGAEASALASRMDTEVGIWTNLRFGSTSVDFYRISLVLQIGEYDQAAQFAERVHPELLPTRRQVEFWGKLGPALVAKKKTRDKGVRVLLHAERLAPQRVRHDVLVREAIAGLWRQARRDAAGRELRGLAWRIGIAPIG